MTAAARARPRLVGRRTLGGLLAALTATAVLGIAGATALRAEPPPPIVTASLTGENIGLHDWPAGTALTVTVAGAPFAVTTDAGGNAGLGRETHGVDLVPGVVITATDGTTTKSLTLAQLTFDSLDHVTNVAAGTAAPGTQVEVDVHSGSGNVGNAITIADAGGNWSIDFTPIVDIQLGMGAAAHVIDEDGDDTRADRFLQQPSVNASLTHDYVDAQSFAAGTTVTFAITPPGGGAPAFTGGRLADGNGHAFLDATEHGLDLVPGTTVTAGDGTVTKTLVLVSVTFDVLDIVTDAASGTAPPGATVRVDAFGGGPSGTNDVREVVADGAGAWAASFAGSVDITFGSSGHASVADGDGDSTSAQLFLPNPSINASVSHSDISLHDFAASSPVALEIFAPGASVPSFSNSVTTDAGGHVFVEGGDHGQTLVPGSSVTADDGTAAKSVTLAALSFDSLDPDTDVAAGTAPPGSALQIDLYGFGVQATVQATAGAGGGWSVDLTGTFDVQPGHSGHVLLNDGDNDYTSAQIFLTPPAHVEASLDDDWIALHGFAPGGEATVEITKAGAATPVFTGTVQLRGDGEGFLDPVADLEPGDTVRVTDGTTAKELVLATVTVVVDLDADAVSGTAPPNAEVDLSVFKASAGTGRTVTASATGAWSASFAGEFDIDAGTDVHARVYDDDRDATTAGQAARVIAAHGPPGNNINAEGFRPGDVLTYELRNAGGTLLYSATRTVDEFRQAGIGFEEHGVELVPGTVIRLTGAGVAKELVVTPLTIFSVDPAGAVRGTAAPGATVELWLDPPGRVERVTADAAGVWTVSLGEPIGFVEANTADADADRMLAGRGPARIEAELLADTISAFELGASVPLTIEVLSAPGGAVLFSGSAPSDEWGNLYGFAGHGQDLVPGMSVRVSDGFTTKELELVPLTVDVVNPTTNVVAGTATPGARLLVEIPFLVDVPKCCPDQSAVAAADGSWSVDFTDVRDDDVPGDLFEPANTVITSIADADGDRTTVERAPVEEVSEEAPPGGTVSTDTSGGGATPSNPVATAVTTPTGGTVTVEETRAPAATPETFAMLGYQVRVTAPPATPAEPLRIVFRIDASLLRPGETADTLQVFRNGTFVPACFVKGGAVAEPDPCVTSRQTLADGDAEIVVLTSQASDWVLGVSGDRVPPALVAAPALSVNPKEIGRPTTLTAPAADEGGSGLAGGEFFVGANPGAGNGRGMALEGTTLSATFGRGLAAGIYTVGARAQDRAGNWGPVRTARLIVYDRDAGFVTGGGQAGDARFGLTAKYVKPKAAPEGSFELTVPGGPHFKSRTLEWLVVTGEPRARFRGTGVLDGAACTFEVDVWDGSFGGGDDALGVTIVCGGVERYSLATAPLSRGSVVVHR